MQVLVRDNNVDQALKVLKKKMQREGLFREMKLHNHYEKPSEKRAREKAEAVRRARKLARKRAQREGVLAIADEALTRPEIAGFPRFADDSMRRDQRPPGRGDSGAAIVRGGAGMPEANTGTRTTRRICRRR